MPAGKLPDARLRVTIVGFRVLHVAGIAILREIFVIEELGQNHQIGPCFSRLADKGAGSLDVFIPRRRAAVHLDKGESHKRSSYARVRASSKREARRPFLLPLTIPSPP